MQVVVNYPGSPEEYVADSAHAVMERPRSCPNCGSAKRLRSLGYYVRYLSHAERAGVMGIYIKRFRCHDCRRSVSLLPSFAQPYRLLRNHLVERFFNREDEDTADVLWWRGLLAKYWRRYACWLPNLADVLESSGHLEVGIAPSEAWQSLRDAFGGLLGATERLVRDVRVTLFGCYCCHQPWGRIDSLPEVHTTSLFPTGRDPPICDRSDENGGCISE